MRISVLIILLSSALFISCDEQNGLEIRGSENIVSEVRELPSFESIHISSVINAVIIQGEQAISISANDNIIELVKTEVIDNVLFVDLEDGDYDEISITASISNHELIELTTVGVNSVSVSDFEDLDKLTLNIEGVGNVQLSGSAQNATIHSSGASNLEAFDFSISNCEVNLTGVGNVQITVIDELFGALSGVGNIQYKGTPEIDVEVTGVGNIVNAN